MINKTIAVIGAGYWGKNLVRNFHQMGVLKTVCDQSPGIRKQIQESYPEALVSNDIDTVLKDENIQGVVIAAPSTLHFELADKSLRAGKHVFVEKPMSLTYVDGQKLVSLASVQHKILFVGHILQYHPAVIKLKELVGGGKIGRLQYIYSRRLNLGKIRREENILWSFAPHDISVIMSLVGEEPSYVDSVGNYFLHAQIADITMTNLKFPSGIGAHIFVSWLNPYKEQKLVISGDRGMLVFDDTAPVAGKLVYYPHMIHWENGIPVFEKAESIPVDISDIWREPLKHECEAFLRAIDTGEEPVTSGSEGLRVLKVLEMSQRSLEEKENTQPRVLGPWRPDPDTYSFIHSTAVVDNNTVIGKRTRVWHFSHILSGSRIGENCNIGQNVVIGPDVTIGDRCKIQNNVSVYKGVTLEDGVFCGPSMVFTNIINPRAEISKMDQVRPTLVRKGATLGANATVVCGRTIGQYAFVGAGAVVTKDVPDHALFAGNPARRIGWVCRCGEQLDPELKCSACGKLYSKVREGLTEKEN